MNWLYKISLIWKAAAASALLIAVTAACSASSAWYSTARTANSDGSIAEAANAFLARLSDAQRAEAVYEFDDPARSNWSNLPVRLFGEARNGVRVGDLDDEQAAALVSFLSTALSEHGYTVVAGIVGADRELSNSVQALVEGWSSENYWLAFFGEPSDSGVWGWQFGGHHLALNITVVDGRSYMSPTFLGVEPSSYMEDGAAVAPLAPFVEAGLTLFNALDGATQELATVENRPKGLWTGAGKDGFIPAVEGAPVFAWDESHRQLLLDAISLWLGMLDGASRQARLAEIRAGLDDAYFAWNEDATGERDIYFRIQGPMVIIELSTQGAVGDGGGHYHSIYRDPTNEYGSKVSRFVAWGVDSVVH